MCRRHLLGEHVELHMFVGALNKGISLKGYIDKNLVEVHTIKARHEALVTEMSARHYKHNSPLPAFVETTIGVVDPVASTSELLRRCPDCSLRASQLLGRVTLPINTSGTSEE